jgi:signal transduction histidine kinase
MDRHRAARLGPLLLWAGAIVGAGGATAAAADPGAAHGPTPIANIMASPAVDSSQSLPVQGVVTLKLGEGLVVQDDTAGIWIEVTQARRLGVLETDVSTVHALREGDLVDVVGQANRGGYAPNLIPVTIRKLGVRPLPEARPYDRNRFFLGLDDCLRVEAAGVVQGFRDDADNKRWLFLVSDVTRDFWVDVAKEAVSLAPERYIDASVRCAGVATADFNTRGELITPRLNVCRADEFVVDQPAGDVREVKLAEIGRYPDTSHRVRTQGVVTYSEPGSSLYLQSGYQGVLVESPSPERFDAGDWVEVVGFVDGTGPVCSIAEAQVRRLRSGAPLAPIAIHPAEILRVNTLALSRFDTADPGDYYGCLVTFPATVVDVSPAQGGGEVRLLAEDVGLTAISGLLGFIKGRLLEAGSRVQVTGIVRPVGSARRHAFTVPRSAAAPPLEILLRSPDDLKLLRAPSWWKPHRLAAVIAALAAAMLAVLGWVWVLRRQVSRQVGVIEQKLQFEAVAGERLRIAREFHDTLEQDLAGIALRLDAAADLADDERSRRVLEQQRGLLEQVRRETHDFLWDLRDPARTDGSLVESLAAQIAYAQTLTNVPIGLQLAADVVEVSPSVQFHLLRIVREAVTNALKHGAPTRVDLRLCASASGHVVEVTDDGKGFDVSARSTLEGHFGLRGMTERARRMGATLVIDSGIGRGTTIRLIVPAEPQAGLSHESAPDGSMPRHETEA